MENCMAYTDVCLLQRIAEGDEIAFKRLFDNYYNKLKRFSLLFIKDGQGFEEIIQDVFVKIWLHRQQLTMINNMDAYIYTMTRNGILNELKKASRKKKAHEGWLLSAIHNANTETVENNHDAHYAEFLNKMIRSLPPQQQKIYILNKLGNHTKKQIAAEMGLSQETVKKHLQLANRSLKKNAHTWKIFKLHGLLFFLFTSF
ncbi:MAG: RNA polymerase sigma-70 factor [Chitinophagaceae bacterium]